MAQASPHVAMVPRRSPSQAVKSNDMFIPRAIELLLAITGQSLKIRAS